MVNKVPAQKENKTLCCFPVETLTRDLDARLYLALICLKGGFDCLVGAKGGVHEEMFKQKRSFFYFAKGINYNQKDFFSKIDKAGGYLIYLDEEGGVYDKSLVQFYNRYNERSLRLTKKVFLWGEEQHTRLKERLSPEISEKMVVSGHPRFDLRKPRFAPFYHRLRQLSGNKMENQPYVLFNASFPYGNNQLPKDKYIEFQKNSMGEMFDLTRFERQYAYYGQLVKLFAECVAYCARRFPDTTFILRPHPAEDMEVYRGLFGKYSNVIVTRDGSVQEWIVDALCVVHHDCTTAIEAALCGKDIYSYCPIFDEDVVQVVPVKISPRVETKEEIGGIIAEKLTGQETAIGPAGKERLAQIQRIIANVDFDSSELILEELKKMPVEQIISPEDVDIKKASVARKMYTVRQIKTKIRNKFLRTFSNDFRRMEKRSRNKFPGISFEDIQSRIRMLREVNTDIPDVKVREVAKDTFLLST